MPDEQIQVIRDQLNSAETMLQRVEVFIQLWLHADLTWADLLLGLEYPGFFAEQASISLHQKLEVSSKHGCINDASFWKDELRRRELDENEKCGPSLRVIDPNEIE